MKYLGIDYGTKRVGLAVSDENGKIAFPYKTLANDKGLVSIIYDICQNEGVGACVVGESLDFNGNPNELMNHINKFVLELGGKINLPINMQKEFMTTVNARQQPGGGGAVDASAAALILQRYLDKINTTQITN